MPIPLYGFLKGDTLGLVFIGHEDETVLDLARKLQQAAAVRVNPCEKISVYYEGKKLDLQITLRDANLKPLSRFDVIPEENHGV